jgi:membrane protease YdiL (CAAX protease family)
MGRTVDSRYPSIGQGIILLLLVLGIQILLGMIVGIVKVASGGEHVEAWQIALVNSVGLGLVLVAGKQRTGLKMSELLPFKSVSFGTLVAMSLTIIGLNILLVDLSYWVCSFLPKDEFFSPGMEDALREDANPWWILFLLVVIAPLTEEPLFRGLMLRGFLLRYSALKAIVVSAILFAIMHMNPVQLATAFILGLLFGWWRLRTRSIWPCIWGHALNNGIVPFVAMAGMHFAGYSVDDPSDEIVFHPLWFDAVGAIMAATGLVWTVLLFRMLPPVAMARAAGTGVDDASTSLAVVADGLGTPCAVEGGIAVHSVLAESVEGQSGPGRGS